MPLDTLQPNQQGAEPNQDVSLGPSGSDPPGAALQRAMTFAAAGSTTAIPSSPSMGEHGVGMRHGLESIPGHEASGSNW